MSQGSPRRTMRFAQQLVDQIDAAILSANDRRHAMPYDWTAWVLKAVTEKLAHLRRGKARRARAPRRARGQRPADLVAGPPVEGASHLPASLV